MIILHILIDIDRLIAHWTETKKSIHSHTAIILQQQQRRQRRRRRRSTQAHTLAVPIPQRRL